MVAFLCASTDMTTTSTGDVEVDYARVLDLYGDVFHEWNTEVAERFFALSGISKRNWRIYMRRKGLADGKGWTLRAIADAEGISHIRVRQIEQQTEKNFAKFVQQTGG